MTRHSYRGIGNLREGVHPPEVLGELNSRQVSLVATTALRIDGSYDTLIIKNDGNVTVYIGASATNHNYPLDEGDAISLTLDKNVQLWAYAASNTTLRILEGS